MGFGAGGGTSAEQVLQQVIQHPRISAGAPWYNSATGYLYVYVDDGDSPTMGTIVAGNVFSGL